MGRVLMYHIHSGEYRLVSDAYKTALANLKEEDLEYVEDLHALAELVEEFLAEEEL
jgi:Holliday junction resolvasome RuvABC ATP-dependent DNA helicase subunit